MSPFPSLTKLGGQSNFPNLTGLTSGLGGLGTMLGGALGGNPFSFAGAWAQSQADKANKAASLPPTIRQGSTGAYANHARLSHLQPYITKYAAQGGYPEMLAALTALAESDANPMAFNETSFATGLFQALPTSYLYPGGGRGREFRYGGGGRADAGIQGLYDIDRQFQLAQPDFQRAWQQAQQDVSEDGIERFVRAVALAQRYENYEDPYSKTNNNVRRIAAEIYGQFYPPTPPVADPTGEAALGAVSPAAAALGRFQAVSQFDLPLDPQIAAAFCGPAAAIAFARWNGRMPTTSEALNLARQVGWSTGPAGMGGPQNLINMLQTWGIQAELTNRIDPARMIREVQAGRPVIIDTPLHYYQITGYNPQLDQFQFGDGVGRGRWSSLANLGQWNFGDPRSVIYAR